MQHFFKTVISVKEDDSAFTAFELMVEKDIQGVAVVDSDGRLVGNLSIRDLKIVGADMSMFWRLQQSVSNFLIKGTPHTAHLPRNRTACERSFTVSLRLPVSVLSPLQCAVPTHGPASCCCQPCADIVVRCCVTAVEGAPRNRRP